MVTMLLGGLWHGANWTFVGWGLYHGCLLVGYRTAGHYWDRLPALARQAGTFVLVLLGWVLFRADNFEMAWILLTKMFTVQGGLSLAGAGTLVGFLAVAGGWAHFGPNAFQLRHEWRPVPAAAIASLFLLCLLAIYGGEPSPFLYFQF
jgi:alginate O-acetyltransferase complex protein AlgI